MDGLNELNRGPMTLLSFNRREDLNKYALGVDRDIGGTSSAHLDFVPSSSDANVNNKNDAEPLGTVKFWGDMRLAVRNDLRGRIRGGYAGFRSKVYDNSIPPPLLLPLFSSPFLPSSLLSSHLHPPLFLSSFYSIRTAQPFLAN